MTFVNTELPNYLLGMRILAERKRGEMDIRDPIFRIGCCDDEVLARIDGNGQVHRRPPCCDCEARQVECDDCEDIDKCPTFNDDCELKCKWHDICKDDVNPDFLPWEERDDLPDYQPSGLCFHLTEFHIHQIDNGLLCTYELNDREHSRYFPDSESLSRFIDQHTD